MTNTRTVTVNRNVPVTPNKGSLVVSAEPKATIVVEPVGGGTGDEGEVPADRRTATFNDLLPGRYRVAAALEGYEEASSEVTIVKGKASDVTLNLRPITYNVNINANVAAGEIRYAPVNARTDPSTGQLKYERVTGDTRVTPIRNGRAVLSGLRAGTYALDIRAEEEGYETLLASITLPGPTDIPITLTKTDTTTGAFEGRITNARTGAPIAGAAVVFTNKATGVPMLKITDADGRFYQGLLLAGDYTIRVSRPGFKPVEVERRLLAGQTNRLIPLPTTLEPEQ